jgi:NAD(P)H dehydrogenase (quinone)
MILITGATGHLGRATIQFLQKKNPSEKIAALVRDETKAVDLRAKGVEIRTGNYDDRQSLVKAFIGIDKLFFISGNDVVNRLKQHENVVSAAKEAGVKHIIYTSFSRKNETEASPLGILATSHIETDKMIKSSGIPYTLMLNSLYADVLPMFFGDRVLNDGIFLPAGNGRTPFTTRNDIAEAAANILTTPGHENKEYIIANTENYSLQQAADILSHLSGKKIPYSSPEQSVYKETLAKAGVPAEYVNIISSFSEAIRQGEFETPVTDLENLLKRKPVSLEEFFRNTYFSKN